MALRNPLDPNLQSNVLQLRNDYARHEAFITLFTLSLSRKEDIHVPDLALVGMTSSSVKHLIV
jgi:hypothetical protein